MASTIKSLINSARKTLTGASRSSTSVDPIFPQVDPAIDGDDCDHDCASCVTKYPKGFKIDEDDQLYGQVKGWSTHLIVATGKSDWVRDVADEKGSVMAAIDRAAVKPSNGVSAQVSVVDSFADVLQRLMLSASNIPTLSHTEDYSQPTTVLLLPAFVEITNVTPKAVPTLISEFIDKGPTNMTPMGPLAITSSLPDPLPSAEQLTCHPSPHRALILLCSQKTRDARCGQSAPLLRRELERHLRPLGLYRDLDDTRPGGVVIYFISHVGGHKYSANLMIYRRTDAFRMDSLERAKVGSDFCPAPVQGDNEEDFGAAQCIWIARVRPEDCEGIVKYTVLQCKVVKPERQLRGGFDRQKGLYTW